MKVPNRLIALTLGTLALTLAACADHHENAGTISVESKASVPQQGQSPSAEPADNKDHPQVQKDQAEPAESSESRAEVVDAEEDEAPAPVQVKAPAPAPAPVQASAPAVASAPAEVATYMYCEPLTTNGVTSLKTKILMIGSRWFSGVSNPLHCTLRFKLAENNCKVTYLGPHGAGGLAGKVATADIPCEAVATAKDLPETTLALPIRGCDPEKLKAAAELYDDTRNGEGDSFTASRSDGTITAGHKKPYGYGGPQYMDNPFAKSGRITCNTYVHWALLQAGCAKNVKFPHDAVGWDATPKWYGPADSP